jgi:hypothetical protein
MNAKYIDHIHTHSSFPYGYLSHEYSPPEKIFLTQLSFSFDLYTDSLRGVHLGTAGLYIWCINQINPPITYSVSFTMLP